MVTIATWSVGGIGIGTMGYWYNGGIGTVGYWYNGILVQGRYQGFDLIIWSCSKLVWRSHTLAYTSRECLYLTCSSGQLLRSASRGGECIEMG